MADFLEYNDNDESILYNMTKQELLERLDVLERQLDFYIPMYWSLVVILVAIAFFVCVLILPERRRRYFKELLRVETLKANHETEEDFENSNNFPAWPLWPSNDDNGCLEIVDSHSNDESLFNALDHEPSAQDNEGFDPDDVDLNNKHRYLKRAEVILKPRTLPDFQEIVTYKGPNNQPVYYQDMNSKDSGQDYPKSTNFLNPEGKRKTTREAVQAAFNRHSHEDDVDNYVTKPNITKEDEDYKSSIQMSIPGLSITRPSLEIDDLG